MQELQDKIHEAFQAMVTGGKLDELVETKVEACVTSILADALRPHSTFGKALREGIEHELRVNIEELGLGGYNDFVAEVVKAKIQTAIEGEWRQDLERSLDAMLRSAPETIKLSELLEAVVEDHEDEAAAEHWAHATLFREASRFGRDSTWVHLDPQPRCERHRCSWSMLVRESGEVFTIHVDGKDQKALLTGRLYGMERRLFQLRAGRTKIELDLEEGRHTSCYSWND